jgi:hypothetical protein
VRPRSNQALCVRLSGCSSSRPQACCLRACARTCLHHALLTMIQGKSSAQAALISRAHSQTVGEVHHYGILAYKTARKAWPALQSMPLMADAWHRNMCHRIAARAWKSNEGCLQVFVPRL